VNENATEPSGKNDLNKNLIKRFNFHSTMILKSTLDSETNNDTSTTNGMEIDDNDDDDDDNVSKRVNRSQDTLSNIFSIV
jgi:hypothetical protein